MRVLVVEDSTPIRKSVVQGLREAGCSVDEASDGEEGLRLARTGEHDVIVLDLMLPIIDGMTVLKSLRQVQCPAYVLVLTARDASEDRVKGLDTGADDYLVKPFHFAELLARIKALLRRKYETKSTQVTVADLVVDLSAKTARRGGQLLGLSAKEFALLEYLALKTPGVVSRVEIWQHVYDVNAMPESNVVDVFVARVRGKLEGPGKPQLIHTRRGQGYFLELLAEDDGAA
jgi:DNA-binding response OmpR family regulator